MVIFLQRGVFVAGLREEFVSNAEQVHKLLEAGEGRSNIVAKYLIPFS